MPICSIVNLLPLGTVDDLMHYCTRPSASCNSVSGRPRHLGGNSFDYTTNRHEITVYYETLCPNQPELYGDLVYKLKKP